MGVEQKFLSDRKQFVQFGEKNSSILCVSFEVHLGSILVPIFFNLYVSDFQDNVSSIISQCADDTSFYEHTKIKDLQLCVS